MESTKKERIDWLNHVKKQKQEAIQEWRIIAMSQNIRDKSGVNPIVKLQYELEIIKDIQNCL